MEKMGAVCLVDFQGPPPTKAEQMGAGGCLGSPCDLVICCEQLPKP